MNCKVGFIAEESVPTRQRLFEGYFECLGLFFFYLVVILCLLHQKTKKKGEDLVFFGLRVGCISRE